MAAKQTNSTETQAIRRPVNWQADFLNTSVGLRGVLILWIFVGHFNGTMGFLKNFNTGTFFMLSFFTAYMQTRNKEIKYSKWLLQKWFGLIPLSLLASIFMFPAILFDGIEARNIQGLVPGSHLVPVSVGTQVYLILMQIAGFGWLGSCGNFGFVNDLNSFNTDSKFGDVGQPLSSITSALYFPTYLFTGFVAFAVFHYTLRRFQLPRNVFQGAGGLVAAVIGFGLTLLSIWCYALGDSNSKMGYLSKFVWNTGVANIMFFPIMAFAVCLAELRFHLPPSVQSVLGHWLVVDGLLLAFFGLSWGAPQCIGAPSYPTLSAAAISAFCDTDDVTSWVVNTVQIWLFGLVLLSLSCQAFHRRRSIAVHFFLERGPLLLPSLWGRYSYTLFLFQITLIQGAGFNINYFAMWLCPTLEILTITAKFPKDVADSMYKTCLTTPMQDAPLSVQVLAVLAVVVLAVLAQKWQDTYVTAAHLTLMEHASPEACFKVLADDKSPLSPLVLMLCHSSASAQTTPQTQISDRENGTLSDTVQGSVCGVPEALNSV